MEKDQSSKLQQAQKNFGSLLKELRTRQRNENGNIGMTREELAKRSGIEPTVLGNVERGEKRGYIEHLVDLAISLELTTKERKEFYLAALDIENKHIISQVDSGTNTIFQDLKRLISEAPFPAFILDNYCDVLCLNAAIRTMFDITEQDLKELSALPTGFNLMSFLFSPKADKYMDMIKGQRTKTLIRNIQMFRAVTLRYRTTPYYDFLHRKLVHYEKFQEYWYRAYKDRDRSGEIIDYHYTHRHLANHISYQSTSSTSFTEYGELHLIQYIPTNPDTLKSFSILHEKARIEYPQITICAGWPDKHFD